ncbi:HAAS signaling domain-containing protein [Bacillus alkalisoli]|uniref:HAAS signaling domain-containing protein n=1 Tax=Bacillus alkalisoli TaxID=2011008 RepID=UPI000C2302C2|nr:hypothetical protein [Bacillus alkalisoli]
MSRGKELFLNQLEKELEFHPNSEDILLEYEVHYESKLRDLILTGLSKEDAEENVLEQLGNPKIIASQFCYKPLSKKKLSNVTVTFNYLLFLTGILLTISLYSSEFPFATTLWQTLAQKKWFVLFLYFSLWIVVGYAIGRIYGFNGKETLNTILKLALVPNVILMLLVLYFEPIKNIFEPLLSPAFFLTCVIVTILFYPISKISYKYGITKG